MIIHIITIIIIMIPNPIYSYSFTRFKRTVFTRSPRQIRESERHKGQIAFVRYSLLYVIMVFILASIWNERAHTYTHVCTYTYKRTHGQTTLDF